MRSSNATVLLAIFLVACRQEKTPAPPVEYVPASREEVLSLQHDPGITSGTGMVDHFRHHLAGTDRRPDLATREDSSRARDLAAKIKSALAKYADVSLARADGFTLFNELQGGSEIHFNKYDAPAMTIDPAKPSALLYDKDSAGKFVLSGAMYNVSARATEKDLEKLTPLSIVQWHRHVNVCIPPLDKQERWTEKKDGRYIFGQMGYSTKAECDQVGGLFRTDLAGWMVHAYPFNSDDLGTIWGGAQMGAVLMEGHSH